MPATQTAASRLATINAEISTHRDDCFLGCEDGTAEANWHNGCIAELETERGALLLTRVVGAVAPLTRFSGMGLAHASVTTTKRGEDFDVTVTHQGACFTARRVSAWASLRSAVEQAIAA